MSDRTLREMIREMIKQELEENSTSAATPGYLTPMAFKKTDPEGDGPELMVKKNLKENRYLEFKQSEGTTAQKIGRAITEINRSLTELSHVVEMSARLKTECNVEGTGLWKRTGKHLAKMEGKLVSLSNKIRELKS
jgi:hypothetical protein